MIFGHGLKNKRILLIVFAATVSGVFLSFAWHKFLNERKSDLGFGNGVQNAEISNADEASFGFGNNQIEKAIADYLLTQKQFAWKTQENGYNFCSIENLDPEKELFPLYVWAYCAEYIIKNNELKTLSGSSGPVRIDYPNELSFYDLDRFSHEVPRNGSYYSKDIKKIFPENIHEKIFNFDPKNIIKENETAAFAEISAK